MRRFKFPIAPILLGILLGPLIEQEFRRSLSISAGDFSILVTRPLALTFLAISVISILASAFGRKKALPMSEQETAIAD